MNPDVLCKRHLINNLKAESKRIIKYSVQVHRHPNGKCVHDLRVAVRKLRSVLWVLKESSKNDQFEKLDNRLQKLGQALGKVREMDVALIDALHYEIDPSHLEPTHTVAVKNLRKLLGRKPRKDLNRILLKSCKEVSRIPEIHVDFARKKINRILKDQSVKKSQSPASLHQLRIRVKKARYALEAMGSKRSVDKPIQPMKKLQDVLGRSHDLEFLQVSLGRNQKIKNEQTKLNAQALRLSKNVIDLAVSELNRNKRG